MQLTGIYVHYCNEWEKCDFVYANYYSCHATIVTAKSARHPKLELNDSQLVANATNENLQTTLY